MTGFPEFPCPRKKAEYGHEVQASENDRQRRYGKVWDAVLNDYGGVEFKGNM